MIDRRNLVPGVFATQKFITKTPGYEGNVTVASYSIVFVINFCVAKTSRPRPLRTNVRSHQFMQYYRFFDIIGKYIFSFT